MKGKGKLAALAAVAGLLVGGCADPLESSEVPTARERIEAASDEDVPLAVPTEMPDGYGLVGNHGVMRRDGEAVAALWMYAVGGEGSAAPVQVCVLASDADQSACPASVGSDPIERQAGRYRVLVSSASRDDPDATAWDHADFTADWQRVDWIDTPAAF